MGRQFNKANDIHGLDDSEVYIMYSMGAGCGLDLDAPRRDGSGKHSFPAGGRPGGIPLWGRSGSIHPYTPYQVLSSSERVL